MISRVVFLLLALYLVSLSYQQDGFCYISTTSAAPAGIAPRGRIIMSTFSGYATFRFELEGLGANKTRGFHGHTYGAIYTNNGTAVAGHYDPNFTYTHANPDDGLLQSAHHAGDFGNVTADANGAVMDSSPYQFTQVVGTNNLYGRALIIHANPDLGVAYNTSYGLAGQRIGQCVMQALSSSFTVPSGIQYASVELKRDMSTLSSQGRVAIMDNGDGSLNYKVRICGLPANANVTLQPGSFNDVNATSTFSSSLTNFMLTANSNGVVDANFNSTAFTVTNTVNTIIARPVAVMDASGNVIMRGVTGISPIAAPLTGPSGTIIIPTCDPTGPTPGTTTTPPPPGGHAGQLLMGVSTILLIIASLFMF